MKSQEAQEEATETGSSCQMDTKFGSHDGWVMERIADSYVPVNGHCCQDSLLRDRVEEVHLHEATSKIGGLLLTD